jgi:glycosyltransferase involved in cell wall biosynthesis
MRIGLIASPFIPVPPTRYGGTELFVANLAESLRRLNVHVSVYANGESTVRADVRWVYPKQDWPLPAEMSGLTKDLDHISWSIKDATEGCDLVHVSNALAVPFSRLSPLPFVCTLHHPCEPSITDLYERYRTVTYVSISHHQAAMHPTVASKVIHHGLDLSRYRFAEEKEPYLCFLGRICPIKGTHHAIAIARQLGMPLKIAGEVQPIFQNYYDTQIRPYVDGRNVEFLGEADFSMKNDLLSRATALLFPIEWEEPFGLVMVEAMACGTPVIAFPGGAVEEIVSDGISGTICHSVEDAVQALRENHFEARAVRDHAERHFSATAMARKYHHLYMSILNGGLSPVERGEEAA